jgi:glycerophosphoryl diester phosphodiesterase
MNQDRPAHHPGFYSQIDVSQLGALPSRQPSGDASAEIIHLLRQILAAQERQILLLQELLQHWVQPHRQRLQELAQWRQANPELAKRCRAAAEALAKVHTDYLHTLTEEVLENIEVLRDEEFMLSEFVDRFGPRIAHLNGLLQLLYQLGYAPDQSSKQP